MHSPRRTRTEEDGSLSNSSLHQEEEAKGNVRMDYSALTKEDKNIKEDGSLSNSSKIRISMYVHIYECIYVCMYVCYIYIYICGC